MSTAESNNLLEVWDKLCFIINNKGSVTRMDPGTKPSEMVQFNQIKLNRDTALWQALMDILEPLSEEEVEVLLDLAETNNTHNVYQSRVSIVAFVSIPIGLISIAGFFIKSFDPRESMGFLVAAAMTLILGGSLLYKQLAYRWLSMELSTCLETTLALKKAERIQFKKYQLPQFEDRKSKIPFRKQWIKRRSKN